MSRRKSRAAFSPRKLSKRDTAQPVSLLASTTCFQRIKRAIAEGAIACAAMRLGVGVFRAVADERYDLILDTGRRLLRVQCKTAALKGDVVLIQCYSCRRTAGGLLKRSYTSEEVDVIAAHCDELGRSSSSPSHVSMAAPTSNSVCGPPQQPNPAIQLGRRFRLR